MASDVRRAAARDIRAMMRPALPVVFGPVGTVPDHELWSSDGTSNGTVQAVDIHPTGSSFPRDLVRLGRSIVFSATDGEHGRELWVVTP